MVRIPDEHALECWRKAGRIASECREWAREAIRPGVHVREILETIEAMIYERGAAPGFPAQSSRNHVAAHYCSAPEDDLKYEEGDCVKVDMGAHVDGYIADTACSVDLSEDKRWTPLVTASADALRAALQRLLDDDALLARLARRLPRVKSIEENARELEACYQGLGAA